MVAGQPLRVQQDDRLSAAHGNRLVDGEDMTLGVGGIDSELDGAGISAVGRRRDRRRHGYRLWSRRLREDDIATDEQRRAGSEDGAAEQLTLRLIPLHTSGCYRKPPRFIRGRQPAKPRLEGP